MSLLSRYLIRLHAGPFAFALGAVTGIMLLNQIAKRLGDLLGKGLPVGVIVEVFALSLPFILALSFPIAVLVAVLFGVSRLAGDSEITALRAGGVSLWRILRPLLVAGAVLTLLAFAFNDQVLPRSNHRLRTLYSDIYRKKPTFVFQEQVINEVQPGRLFLRATTIDRASYALHDVTIYDLANQDRKRVIYADSGYLTQTEDQQDLNLTLFSGTMHEFDRSDPKMFQQVAFVRDLVRVRGVGNELRRTLVDPYKSDREMGICEMEQSIDAARREGALADRRAAAVRLNGLRSLVGLADVPPDTVLAAPRRSLYCAALERWAAWLLPPTLEAQEPPRRVADSLPRFAKPAMVPRVRRATSSPALRAAELRTYEDRARQSHVQAAHYLVEVHKKYVIAVACFVFVLVGVPTAIRFPRGGLGLVLGIGFVITGFYYIVLIAGESLADKLVAPPAILWTANVLFGLVGLVLLYQSRTAAKPRRFGRLRARRTARP
jgi:lipopolysaccharide export system permease protein